jgi:hypothetical protein
MGPVAQNYLATVEVSRGKDYNDALRFVRVVPLVQWHIHCSFSVAAEYGLCH